MTSPNVTKVLGNDCVISKICVSCVYLHTNSGAAYLCIYMCIAEAKRMG
jgi:hypothetical protein